MYLRTGGIDVALAKATKDSDVAVNPHHLATDPKLEAALVDFGELEIAAPAPNDHRVRTVKVAGPEAVGSMMAGRAEEGIGNPDQVSAASSILAADLVAAFRGDGS